MGERQTAREELLRAAGLARRYQMAEELGQADLLADRGDRDGLRALANAGDSAAAERLARLAIKQGWGKKQSGCASSA